MFVQNLQPSRKIVRPQDTREAQSPTADTMVPMLNARTKTLESESLTVKSEVRPSTLTHFGRYTGP